VHPVHPLATPTAIVYI